MHGYHETHIHKLSETQKSRLRNGHAVRVKIGSGHIVHLTEEQHKKLHHNHKHGKACTITFHPEQAQKHGQGLLGNIFSKAKALIHKHHLEHVVEPLIHGAKKSAHKGISRLSKLAHESIGDGIHHKKRGRKVKGEGVIGSVLSGLINMSGLGIKPKRGRKKKGNGLGSDLAKAAVKAMAPALINKASDLVKSKISGMGVKHHKKVGRPRKHGGALYPA